MSTKFKVGQIVQMKNDAAARRVAMMYVLAWPLAARRHGVTVWPLALYRVTERWLICPPDNPETLGVYNLEKLRLKHDGTRGGCQASDAQLEECQLLRVFIEKMRRKWRRA